jgi:predicted lysophospholipase L1 biosynthesis ABC-type transport system permease subunit
MRGVLGISNYAALVLAITILFSITGIENALQKSIETDISREVPNLYLIDIQKDQQEGLKEIFADTDLTLFPSVRGKLLYVDDFDIQKNYKENREYTRNFSNTYRTEFISGEVITKGI